MIIEPISTEKFLEYRKFAQQQRAIAQINRMLLYEGSEKNGDYRVFYPKIKDEHMDHIVAEFTKMGWDCSWKRGTNQTNIKFHKKHFEP